jgi:hypothetical protein
MNIKPVVTALAVIFILSVTCEPVWAQMALSPEPQLSRPQSERQSGKALAENKFYAKVYGFYGLLAPGGFRGQGIGAQNLDQRFTGSTNNYTTKNSFGTGLRAGAGVGVVLNDFINVGIDGEYVLGNTATESYTRQNADTQDPQNYTLDYSYTIINIIPNITFKAVSKPEYYIYNRIGLVVGIPTNLEFTSLIVENQAGNGFPQVYTEKRTFELEKKIGLGYQAALGIQFRISDNLRGFAEIVSSGLQIKTDAQTFKEGYYSVLDQNGQNGEQIPLNPDPSQREKDGLNMTMPVNSLGLGVGLVFRF